LSHVNYSTNFDGDYSSESFETEEELSSTFDPVSYLFLLKPSVCCSFLYSSVCSSSDSGRDDSSCSSMTWLIPCYAPISCDCFLKFLTMCIIPCARYSVTSFSDTCFVIPRIDGAYILLSRRYCCICWSSWMPLGLLGKSAEVVADAGIDNFFYCRGGVWSEKELRKRLSRSKVLLVLGLSS